MKIQFLGATGTVTGSKYLLTSAHGTRMLIDCGLFQGPRKLRERNWAALPFAKDSIDAVALTHAHIDHSGMLPLLTKRGYKGPILCTDATNDLCKILLPDSGYLQEEDARHARKWKYSRHGTPKPLYTKDDAVESLKAFRPVRRHHRVTVGPDLTVCFYQAGHILGASFLIIEDDTTRVLFSGDVGRPNDILMRAPEPIPHTDYIVTESTYGGRIHESVDTEQILEQTIVETSRKNGTVVVPCFAVGRSQALLFLISELKRQDRIPDLPVFLDSPMAINASDIYCRHRQEHRLSEEQCHATCHVAYNCRTPEESKALGRNTQSKIILSASGMATGGRVLHHLKQQLPDSRNTVLLAGYQAVGTRGRALADDAERVWIHGEEIEILAQVRQLHHLSAHADQRELTGWLASAPAAPKRVFVTHGEPKASMTFAEHVTKELGYPTEVPSDGCEVDLT